MLKRLICLLILIICLLDNSHAQLRTISVEGFGSSPLYSINYESRFKQKDRGHGYRIGLGGIVGLKDGYFFNLPVGYNFLFTRDNRNYIELGLGVTFYLSTEAFNNKSNRDYQQIFGNLQVGYRSTIGNSPFYWRFAWSPIITDADFRWLYAGFSLGYQWY